MSNRDRFVKDAGTSSTLFPSSEYLSLEHPQHSPFSPYPSEREGSSTSNMLSQRSFGDSSRPYGYRAEQSSQSEYTRVPEQHELSTYPNNPFDERQNEQYDPFGSSSAGYNQGSSWQHGNSYSAGNPDNSFNGNTYGPQGNYAYAGFPKEDADASTSDEMAESKERRFRHNERNRRKLEARLPRFHYTKLPWFNILATTVQIIMFIIELARMGQLTGSPFQTKPYFNPMLGPSTYLLVNMGARYVPCMHKIDTITTDTSIQFPCPNSTTTDTNVCNLSELCGLGGIPIVDNQYSPAQYFRIVLPIFLHAGFLHIIFNLLLQLTMGLSVERNIGWLKYGIIYMASGISGFLLGANFSPNGIASTGASGALFGIIAANLILFIFCGRSNTNIYATKHYKTFILIMVAEIIISLVLGLLPGLDNFSHIGGFCMGILTSFLLLPDPSFVYIDGIYTYQADTSTWELFLKNWNPLNNLEDKILWKVIMWGVVRVISLALAIVYFALLVKNLKSKQMEENKDTCSWCKYINCIPVNGWCEMGVVSVETTGPTTTSAPTATATPTTNSVEITSFLPTEIVNSDNGQRDAIVFEEVPQGTENVPELGKRSEVSAYSATDFSQSISIVVVMGFLCYRMIRRTHSE